ncbi:MAG: Mpo1-like protein [Myxococcota bacterium]
MNRIQSLNEFWPYYLSEHRSPVSRALHFVGTTGFFASIVASLAWNPMWFSVGLAVAIAAGWWGATRIEPHRAAFLPMALIVVPMAVTSPWVLGGVVGAYACAWIGHFRVEHNRPATFTYPVWSFLCDFRMWGNMARGRLWSGDSVNPTGGAVA